MNTAAAIQPSDSKAKTQDKVFDIIFKEDELTWKDMIFDLVRQEGMNPWDIDVSRLAERFLKMLTELKQMDFRVGGKMVLASSLLLKIKSDKLLLDDIAGLDNLINGPEEEEFLDEDGEFEQFNLNAFLNDQKKLVPRTPQPRERKVSVYDLVDALEQALDLDLKRQRTLSRVKTEDDVRPPVNNFDLNETMNILQDRLKKIFMKSKRKVFFDELLPSKEKTDMVYTFMPLLHLENQQKVHLLQEEHFGPIEVTIHQHKL